MPTTTFERVTDDDAVEIEVEFTLTGGSPASGMSGPPEFYDPGEGPEFCIESAHVRATGEPVTLTDEEAAKVEVDVLENAADYEDDGSDYFEDF